VTDRLAGHASMRQMYRVVTGQTGADWSRARMTGQEVHVMTDGPDSNAAIAVEFLQQAAAGHAREAFERLGAPDFRHHNPWFAGDGASLTAAMDENARENPDKILDVKRTIAEGPFVALHTWIQQRPGELGSSVVHIFRIEDGRIRELWDIGQDVPAESPNEHGMF
jgi:predicted SnoaL-like aldol condensation-catalyzing enzyme